MRSRNLFSTKRRIQVLVATLLIVGGLLARFAFGWHGFLPVASGITGIWLLLGSLRGALAIKSPYDLHRRETVQL